MRLGGRQKGTPNKRTASIGHTLDANYAKVTRTLLDDVIPDRQLAQLLWKLALEGDGRVATYLADRKWGRVKFEVEGEGPVTIVVAVGGNPNGGPPLVNPEYKPMAELPRPGPLLLPEKAIPVPPDPEKTPTED